MTIYDCWSEEDIVRTLKSFKNGKRKDPLGLVNEIFKPPTAGTDMVQSFLLMMNKIKKTRLDFPKFSDSKISQQSTRTKDQSLN